MRGSFGVETLPFCDYVPQPFTSLARNKKGLIAASRVDGSIDVYDEKDGYYLISHFPSPVLKSVFAVCWANGRLFATGGEGRVYELEIFSVQPKSSLLLPGGLPSRCIVAGSDCIIVGNDGGYISLIIVASGSFDYKTCFAKVEGKVLCIAIDDKKHQVVAVGDSKGKVHIFDLKSGASLSTYTIGSELSRKPAIVWSLAFVGGVLFSGDSSGCVSVWDVEVGSLVSSFKSHSADVLALAVSADNQSVFAAGVDPIIHRFDLCQTESVVQWQPSGILRGCQRDVRSLIFIRHGEASGLRSCDGNIDHLLAVGNETRLQLFPCPKSNPGDKTPVVRHNSVRSFSALKLPPPIYLPFWPLSVTPSLPMVIRFAENSFLPSKGSPARLCLMQHADYMCLYRLPPKPKRMFESKQTTRCFLKVAHVQPKCGNRILTSCISSCGKLIAYSDEVRSRILKISHPNSWKFNPDEPGPLVSISRLGWVNDGRRNLRSRTPSTSSDADNSDSEDGCLFLDQSSADLFVQNHTKSDSFDEKLQSRKRKASPTRENHTRPDDQRDEASACPSARLMAFTPDSHYFISVDALTKQVSCRNLDSGVEVWRLTPGEGSGGSSSTAHLISIAQSSVDEMHPEGITLLALACLDGRVLVYAFNANYSPSERPLFTCPKAADLERPRHHPRPVSICSHVARADNDSLNARVTILYTTGQITEWNVPLCVVESEGVTEIEMAGTPHSDAWLEEFWIRHSLLWRRNMPRFHSMGYLICGQVILLSSRTCCISIDKRKAIQDNDIPVALRQRNRKLSGRCLRIFAQMKTILQCEVLPDRVAVLRMDDAAAVAGLPTPLQKKHFGT